MSIAEQMKKFTFDAIAISVASPEEILSWSHGEVKKPETINYRTQKPERDGLFCERIFGPTKNWECYCGKYKRIRYKGVICEKCGVEVTRSLVRRERMGHIKLAVPVTHIWFLRSTPSRIGLLLNLPIKTLEQVVYFAAYIVTEIDDKAKEDGKEQLLTEYNSFKKKLQKEYKDVVDEKKAESKAKGQNTEKITDQISIKYTKKIEELDEQHNQAKNELDSLYVGAVISEHQYRDLSMKFGHIFRAGTGAESIREIIANIDLEKLIDELQEDLKKSSGQKHKKLIKRIKFAGSLLKANIKAEWMIQTTIPIIPPDLRPMVQLDGGRFAASDLNDLYRRVINRNNRLKKLITIGAPEVICRNEKRMLQEAVDSLINNSARQGRTVFNAGDKRKLRSLSDMLKGKQGRFRQNLLGKRVDYSGRSVIVVGPRLNLHQCGLPKTMALELFKPFVIGQLIREGYAHNIKNAEKLIQSSKKEVWDILEEITKDHYVLLNRAPTLHRLGIQAFQPVLVEGKAIQIHPLVCAAFNADFDGDQMAVHVPLSKPAQAEAKHIMLSANNLLKPSAGDPIVTPTQDMVLGNYYLTKMIDGKKGEGSTFADLNEAINAYRMEFVDLHAKVHIRINGEIRETTVGRAIFNSFLPEELEYKNETFGKNHLRDLISESFDKCPMEKVSKLADSLKRIGFKFATKSGISIGHDDMRVPEEKEEIIKDSDEIIRKINNLFWKGLITEDERYINTIKTWSRAKKDITETMVTSMRKNEENDIFYMIDSGARGNWGQITQLCGIKGLVANPAGKTIELPIKSNLKEGFTILEYFIATHGGRKGKSDTALKTAEAGYLTRRLVDAVQDIVIRENDCGSSQIHEITEKESQEIGESFLKRIFGRTVIGDIVHPKTGEILINGGEEIDKDGVNLIQNADIGVVKVRSIMTCLTENGICQKCYGKDLGTNQTAELGTAVGIIAAQSIGEPGTQLTMRTFHMGGVAEGQDITQGLTRVEELFEARTPKSPAVLTDIAGKVKIIPKGNQGTEIRILSEKAFERAHTFPRNYEAKVAEGDKVKEGLVIARATTSKESIKSTENGIVKRISKGKIVIETEGNTEKIYKIPSNKTIIVKNGEKVEEGQCLTLGHHNLRELLKLSGIYSVQKYLVHEVQSIYASQGQSINDKHIEIIARQMLSKMRIMDPGDAPFLPGEIVDVIKYENQNAALEANGQERAHAERLLLGLTRIALYTDSWLSAASFQETIRVLVEASTTRKIDELEGLKENVIIGKLIPAGETFKKFHKAAEEAREMEAAEAAKATETAKSA